jgi:hypothetical protein
MARLDQLHSYSGMAHFADTGPFGATQRVPARAGTSSAGRRSEMPKTTDLIERDGKFFLARSDREELEPVDELEARRLLISLVERAQIDELVDKMCEVIGAALPEDARRKIAENTHRAARAAGLTKTGSLPNLDKFIK